jgi:hypothetical protein
MPETLLTQSAVKMYGRVLKGVKLLPLEAGDASNLGFNKFLRQQFNGNFNPDDQRGQNVPRLARIYAFSFEGAFYNLPRPAIFLVHGNGKPIQGSGTYDAPGRNGLAVLDDSGIPARDFVFETDVRYWEYDKDDISLRLDSFSGTLDDILIEAALSSTSRSGLVSRSGMAARSGMASDADESMRHRLR